MVDDYLDTMQDSLGAPEGTHTVLVSWPVITERRNALAAWGAKTLVVDESHCAKDWHHQEHIQLVHLLNIFTQNLIIHESIRTIHDDVFASLKLKR